MLFKTIFSIAALASAAIAQTTPVAFTGTPNPAQVGVPTTITWAGGNGGPVTITLRKGNPSNLATVAVLTGGSTGTSFTWTPSADLPNGNDYALSISQGVGQDNFSGLFSLTGGGSASVTTSGTATILSVAGSTTAAISTLSGPVLNATTTASANLITTVPLVTAPSSAGTGTALPGNTTFSSPTLSGTGTTVLTSLASSATASRSSASAAASSTAGAPMGLQVQGAVGAGALAAALFWL